MPEDPYAGASYLQKLKETKTIALTDLDGTFATREAKFGELGDRREVRRFIEERGYVSGAVTARTPALTMSSEVYKSSCALGFAEEEPRCGFDAQGKRIHVPLEELPFFAHSRDWDVVAGLGWGVFPRNGHGYYTDREFDFLLNFDYAKIQEWPAKDEPLPWRLAAMAFLAAVWPKAYEHLALLEIGQNYRDGITDVMPLPYRIQLEFRGVSGLLRMRELREVLRYHKYENDPIALRLAVVDESRPHEDPEKCEYVIYLLPWAARKEKMINHLLSRSAAAANVAPKSLRLFYAGDTPTDLRAGLWAGGYTPLTFLLATGSRLAPYLIERRPKYGEESLSFLWESGTRSKPRFLKTKDKGVYTFNLPSLPWKNKIVIGDERYPGTTPPGSVLAFLEEFTKTSAPH